MKRLALAAVAAALLVPVGTWAIVRATLPLWARARIERATGGHAEVGQAALRLEPLGLEIRDVTVRAAATGPPVLKAERILADRSGVREITGLRFALSPRPAGDLTPPTARMPIRVRFTDAAVETERGLRALPPITVVEVGPGLRVGVELGSGIGELRIDGNRWAIDAEGIPHDHLTPLAAAVAETTGLSALRGGAVSGNIDVALSAQGQFEEASGSLTLEDASVDLGDVQISDARISIEDFRSSATASSVRRVAVSGGVLEYRGGPLRPADTTELGELLLEDTLLRIGDGETLPALMLSRLRVRPALPLAQGTWELRSAPDDRGTLAASGNFDARTGAVDGRAELQDFPIADWIAAATGTAPRAGRVSAKLDLDGTAGIGGAGSVSFSEIDLRAPSGAPALALGRLEAHLDRFTLIPLKMRPRGIRIAGLRAHIEHDSQGWPLIRGWDAAAQNRSRLTALAAPIASSEATTMLPAGAPNPIVRATLTDASISFRDALDDAPFEFSLSELNATLDAEGGPPWGRVELNAKAAASDGGTWTMSGTIDDDLVRARAVVSRARLAEWNPYLVRHAGHSARGQVAASIEIEWAAGVSAILRTHLEDVTLEKSAKDAADPLGDIVSLPLGRALALMRDSSGNTDLRFDLPGNNDLPLLGFPAAFPDALREALPQAVSVPLFQGAATEETTHVLKPIPFERGTARLTDAARDTVDRLGVLLRWEPTLVIDLAGHRGADEPSDTEAALAEGRARAIAQRLREVHEIAPARVRIATDGTDGAHARVSVRPQEAEE